MRNLKTKKNHLVVVHHQEGVKELTKIQNIEIRSKGFSSKKIFTSKNSKFLYWIDSASNSLISFDTDQIEIDQEKLKGYLIYSEGYKHSDGFNRHYFDESGSPFQFKSYPLNSQLKKGNFKHEIKFFDQECLIIKTEVDKRKLKKKGTVKSRKKSVRSLKKRKKKSPSKPEAEETDSPVKPEVEENDSPVKPEPELNLAEIDKFLEIITFEKESREIQSRFIIDKLQFDTFTPMGLRDGGRILLINIGINFKAYNVFLNKISLRMKCHKIPLKVKIQKKKPNNEKFVLVRKMVNFGYLENGPYVVFGLQNNGDGYVAVPGKFVGGFEDGVFGFCKQRKYNPLPEMIPGFGHIGKDLIGWGKDFKEYVLTSEIGP